MSDEPVEPKLKYQRLGESISLIFENDFATALGAHDKFLALGTRNGAVYITDVVGNAIDPSGQSSITPDQLPPPFLQHDGPVNCTVISNSGDFIASCGEDGKVLIRAVHSSEKLTFSYRGALKSLTLDPNFGTGTNRNFLTGGLAGQVVFNTRGFFRSKDTVLHSGQGTIHSLSWNGDLVAWANDMGVKIYDVTTNQRLTHIDRPRGPPPDACATVLCWMEGKLLISFGRTVKILTISLDNPHDPSSKVVELHSSLSFENFICGIVPYVDPELPNLIALFTHYEPGEPPELIITSIDSTDEVSNDALEVVGFEHYVAKDFSMVSAFRDSDCNYTEQCLFLVSPRDIIIGRPRDVDDHIRWLVDNDEFEVALSLSIEHSAMLRSLSPSRIAGLYAVSKAARRDWIGGCEVLYSLPDPHLTSKETIASWQSLCERACAAGGEAVVVVGGELPFSDSLYLFSEVYESVLTSLVECSVNSGNSEFCKSAIELLEKWPPHLFNITPIKGVVTKRIKKCADLEVLNTLKKLLARLYLREGNVTKASVLLIQLKDPMVVELIKDLNGVQNDHVMDHVIDLWMIDGKSTIDLLVTATRNNQVSINQIVTRLESSERALFEYLHTLFEAKGGITIGKDYHGLQLELYARHLPSKLLPFLKQSSFYPLNKALEVCESYNLHRELVFVLGRMGSSKRALELIINSLRDVKYAIEFILDQNEDDLWDDLISCVIDNVPVDQELVSYLLSYCGVHINPSRIISRIPPDLHISGLPLLLSKIFADYKTQVSLAKGCSDLVSSDSLSLSKVLVTSTMAGVGVKEGAKCVVCQSGIMNSSSAIVFFCSHVVHSSCVSIKDRCPVCVGSKSR
ncbi:hypothetical protein P9112_005483 [Eukaryota sp. TZLM1-RC]